MSIPYRTRRRLKNMGVIALTLAVLLVVAWVAGTVYLERFVIYTRDGVVLDLGRDVNKETALPVEALPPAADETVPIFYNEGANAQQLNAELVQLWGYYISYEDLVKDVEGCRAMLSQLKAGTPVMIELKSRYGTFNYSTDIGGADLDPSVDIAAVDSLIQDLLSRNLYVIARISAFRDRAYGLENVPQGIFHKSKMYLWTDNTGCYWLDPTKPAVIGYVTSIVQELKEMGFDEVMLADFAVPVSDKLVFTSDRNEALATAAKTLMQSCGSDYFTLSFGTVNSSFALPEGRCRIYLEGVSATNVGAVAAQATMEKPEVFLVFVAETNDTRYDAYGVLRPLSAAEVLEANRE